MAVPLRARAVVAPSAVSTYREHPAPGAPAIACTWDGAAGRPRRIRVLPDGCVDLAWDGTAIRVAAPVAGPVRYPVSAAHVGVRLRPGWAGSVLGCPVAEVAPGTLLADVLPSPPTARADDELAAATTPGARRAALVRLVEARGRSRPDPRVLEAVRRLTAGDAPAAPAAPVAPAASVTAVADGVGLGERQLRRLFDHHVGLSPKAFQGVARFRRALDHLRGGARGLAQLAAECGYYDQAHLVRECRRLAGATPTALTAAPAGARRRVG